ncbi:MAG: alpha/beta fold hydrolase [Myxococcota bacterium]|nr:alpha/beta fold hydrolase [Myxococcota bacterium]
MLMVEYAVRPRAKPFELPGDRGAVLMLHGFTGSPYTMRPLGEAIAEAGYHVYAPLIIGHGTTPEVLQHTRWNDWLISARRAFDRLAEKHQTVYLVGFSMGALLSIVVAQERGARVAGLVAMSTPLVLDFKSQTVLGMARRWPIADLIPFAGKKGGPDISDSAVGLEMPSYDKMPIAAAKSLLDGQTEAADRAKRLSIPVLVLHGRHDHTAPVRNARLLYNCLKTPHRKMIVYPQSWHILPLDVEYQDVQRDVVTFLNEPYVMAD